MNNFIPTLWSARMLAHLDANLSALSMVNRDYEGEIKGEGSSVKINQFGAVTISDYTGDLGTPQKIDSNQVILNIDKKKSFNFIVDDVDAAQANVNAVDKQSERAGAAMAQEIDVDLFNVMATGAGIKVGTTAAPIEVSKEDIYDKIVDLGVTLNEKNVSKANRKLVLPPFAIGLLAKDTRFSKNEAVLASGVVGRVGGFDIIESNNLKTTATYTVAVGGDAEATSYAGQFEKVESLRATSSFGSVIRGLNVYGAKVTKANALAAWTIKAKA